MAFNYNISVTHSGEELRITPVVIGRYDGNTMQYYRASEFPPMNIDSVEYPGVEFAINGYGKYGQWVRSIKNPFLFNLTRKLARMFRRIKYVVLPSIVDIAGITYGVVKAYYRRPKWIWPTIKIRYSLSYPVWCRSVKNRLAVITYGQLRINDPDGLTDDYYLTPSQKILKVWYEEKLEEYKNSEYEHERDVYQNYHELKTNLPKDCEICYIAELDT